MDLEYPTKSQSKKYKIQKIKIQRRKTQLLPIDLDYPTVIRRPLSNTTITISFLIIGHGNIINTPRLNNTVIETFKKPNNASQVSVMGLRFAGLVNLIKRDYLEFIDKELTNKIPHDNTMTVYLNKNLKMFIQGFTPEYFENQLKIDKTTQEKEEDEKYIILAKNLHEQINMLRNNGSLTGDNFFGVKDKFTKKNAQKRYFGADSSVFHKEITTSGPLVKIYSITTGDGSEILSKGESIICTEPKNGDTLTKIIDDVVMKVYSTVIIPNFNFDKSKIKVNVLDLTCNNTENFNFPSIGFIE
jgi:hypothetical protein